MNNFYRIKNKNEFNNSNLAFNVFKQGKFPPIIFNYNCLPYKSVFPRRSSENGQFNILFNLFNDIII